MCLFFIFVYLFANTGIDIEVFWLASFCVKHKYSKIPIAFNQFWHRFDMADMENKWTIMFMNKILLWNIPVYIKINSIFFSYTKVENFQRRAEILQLQKIRLILRRGPTVFQINRIFLSCYCCCCCFLICIKETQCYFEKNKREWLRALRMEVCNTYYVMYLRIHLHNMYGNNSKHHQYFEVEKLGSAMFYLYWILFFFGNILSIRLQTNTWKVCYVFFSLLGCVWINQ